jgi:hypothetical protein
MGFSKSHHPSLHPAAAQRHDDMIHFPKALTVEPSSIWFQQGWKKRECVHGETPKACILKAVN